MDRRFWQAQQMIFQSTLALIVSLALVGCHNDEIGEETGGVQQSEPAGSILESPTDGNLNLERENPSAESGPAGDVSGVSKPQPGFSERPALASNSPVDQIPEGKLFRQALDAVDRGQIGDAVKAKQELATHPVYSVLSEALDVLLLASEGRFEEAMKVAEKVSTFQVMQADAYMLAADVFRLQGRFREAIDCLRSSLELNPGNARAQRWLGIIYYDIGAMQQATIHLRAAADAKADEIGALRLSSKIFAEYQNFFEAVSDCQRALSRKPSPELAEEFRLRLADSLRELRRFDEALNVLKDCSSTADTWTSRGRIYEALGQQRDAIRSCRKAVVLDSQHRLANLVLGRVLMAERQFEEAVEPLQIAAAADMNDHESRFLLGRCLLNSGKREKGEAMVALATELKKRFLEITDLHRQAIEDPESADLRFQIGQALEASNREELAKMWYQAALGLDSNHEDARKAYSKISAK